MRISLPTAGLLSTATRASRLWLAALALAVQVLLPVQALRAASATGEAVVLCTAAGPVTLDAAALDDGRTEGADREHASICPLCAGAGGAADIPVDPAAGLAGPANSSCVTFAAARSPAPAAGGSGAYGSRAPPRSI